MDRNRPMTDDKLYTSLSANTIMAKLTNQFQRTRRITSLPDKQYSLDSEDDSTQVVETSVTNNSSFQNYLHPDDHTIRTTDTPGFKPFTMKSSFISAEGSGGNLLSCKAARLIFTGIHCTCTCSH